MKRIENWSNFLEIMKEYKVNDPWDWVTIFEDEVAELYWVTDMVLRVIPIQMRLDYVYIT